MAFLQSLSPVTERILLESDTVNSLCGGLVGGIFHIESSQGVLKCCLESHSINFWKLKVCKNIETEMAKLKNMLLNIPQGEIWLRKI